MSQPLLEIRGLVTAFPAKGAGAKQPELRAVDGISFTINHGETLAIVGESGSGKSMTAFSVLGLVPPPGQVIEGEILFKGQDLRLLPERKLRKVRGAQISMIFQEPMTSLNPVYRIGSQIGEVLRLHRGLSRKAAKARAVELLRLVGIPSPESRVDSYPHQLSGGMRQRVMIAMALACQPDLLLADEPTTALDVTIQAQILDLLHKLQAELGMSILFITHDLGVVAEFASQVAVMYAGQLVEATSVRQLFERPAHPYTRGLLNSVPPMSGPKPERLHTIEGTVPALGDLPPGCRFAERCSLRAQLSDPELCLREAPELVQLQVDGAKSLEASPEAVRHLVRCHGAAEYFEAARANGAPNPTPPHLTQEPS